MINCHQEVTVLASRASGSRLWHPDRARAKDDGTTGPCKADDPSCRRPAAPRPLAPPPEQGASSAGLSGDNALGGRPRPAPPYRAAPEEHCTAEVTAGGLSPPATWAGAPAVRGAQVGSGATGERCVGSRRSSPSPSPRLPDPGLFLAPVTLVLLKTNYKQVHTF